MRRLLSPIISLTVFLTCRFGADFLLASLSTAMTVLVFGFNSTIAAIHPHVLTIIFPHSALKSVPILSDSAISTHSLPASIATFARAKNVKMIGASVLSSVSASSTPLLSGGVLTVESADSQLKRDAREAK